MINETTMNVTFLLNETVSSNGQSISAIISSRVMEIQDFEMSQLPVEVSDKPCSNEISSQASQSVKLTGSLDALLYIVIVLMFYAFSIVILMIKYIRREREEANLRTYYHEFVSREKFKCAQYKNRQFMKRIFKRHGDYFNQQKTASLADARSCAQALRNNQSEIHNFSQVLINTEEEMRTKESFTFLGAKSQFCKKNTLFGKRFCNKQLCSKCVSENVPTIDWDEGHYEKSNSGFELNLNKIIEATLHQAVIKAPHITKTRSFLSDDLQECRSRCTTEDHVFHPIVEKGAQRNDSIQSGSSFSESGPRDVQNDTSFNEHAFVSSCSLEVSELLANMPPLGISNSPSNDMDTLDGLSNLDSDIENQSLLDYSSSIRANRGQGIIIDSKKRTEVVGETNGRFINPMENKDNKLSDRSSLHSCSFSLDDIDQATFYGQFTPKGVKRPVHVDSDLNKTDPCIDNCKVTPILCQSSSEREDDEMVRLLSDITVLADQSGVFKNLKYFLRGFYQSDTDDPTEHSTLLPKETYFGPGSPKSLNRIDSFKLVQKFGTSTNRNDLIQNSSPNVISSQGHHWAYTFDDDDVVISDNDLSSSFGDYCMDKTAETRIIDMSRRSAELDTDSNATDGLSRALIGLDPVHTNNFVQPLKQNPMLAGYGLAHKETNV